MTSFHGNHAGGRIEYCACQMFGKTGSHDMLHRLAEDTFQCNWTVIGWFRSVAFLKSGHTSPSFMDF